MVWEYRPHHRKADTATFKGFVCAICELLLPLSFLLLVPLAKESVGVAVSSMHIPLLLLPNTSKLNDSHVCEPLRTVPCYFTGTWLYACIMCANIIVHEYH